MSMKLIDRVVSCAAEVVLGKEHQLRLAVACLLARGHLLIEDLPGMGKTTLAHVLARVLGLQFHRIQFTSDLLPADIIGVSVFDRQRSAFTFHPGPIFAQVVLADEINRATPKTQSALLEAMGECQVTAEGETRLLPVPFFVIATQNPTDHIGTFPLPESQLDRFLMRIALGYPDSRAERILLQGEDRRRRIERLEPCLDVDQLQALQQAVEQVHVSDALLDYLQALVAFTRESPTFRTGLSPRAALFLLRGARAWALMAGREFVAPEDVQAVLPEIVGHRLCLAGHAGELTANDVAAQLLAVPIP